MDKTAAQRLVDAQPHWHHRFEIYPGVVTPGSYEPSGLFDRLCLPARLDGKRILDIGPSDGYFSLELTRRGAKVTCIDYRRKEAHGFGAMERISGLEFDYHQRNVYDVRAEEFGQFDIVLFLGVLYHLPDMMKALSVLHELCLGAMFVESHCDTELPLDVPAARYYPGDSLAAGDWSNFWSPNLTCMKAMCADIGFETVRSETWSDRALLELSRTARPHKHQIAYGKLG